MCLKINDSVRVEFNEEGYADLYKMAYYRGDRWTAPWLGSVYGEGKEPPRGVFVSNRPDNHIDDPAGVERGVHVFLHLADAVAYKVFPEDQVLKVRCRREHLVAAGTHNERQSAVFTKIEFLGEVVG